MEKSLSEKISILSRIPMFSELNGPEIAFLAEVACERDIAEGETLIFEGDKTKSLFVVIDGKANATGVRSGKRIVLNSFKTGDCFGEMSFLDGEPRCASVEMTETGRVLEIDSEKFRDSIGANPDFVFGITKGLLRKLRGTPPATSRTWSSSWGTRSCTTPTLDTIKRLVLAAECKDNNTCNHVIRVGRYKPADRRRPRVRRPRRPDHSLRRAHARHRKDRHLQGHSAKAGQADQRKNSKS